MRKTTFISLLLSLLVTANNLYAQSIDEGKKFLYYERYNSAKNIFSNLVTTNANNFDAVYWLGQTLIAQEDVEGAKAVYQKALQANPNVPLLLVGMGHVQLLQNNTNDAKSAFETAINLSKSKDANVLNAVGRANIDAKTGDVAYAIDKLKLAAERDKKNPDIWGNLGDAYRKMTDGANAQLAYQSALAIDPKYARASFMMGRIYQTQGRGQEGIYLNYYNNAMTEDPNYAPVYLWLVDYYYQIDVNKARDYLNKYIAVADQDSKNCYYQATILYASNMFAQAVTKANECIGQGGPTTDPRLYGVVAFASNRLGDSVTARKYFESYFAKQKPDKIGPNDLDQYAKVLLKFPGNEALAASYVEKAIAMDTLEIDKVQHLQGMATAYLATKNYNEAAKWYTRILSVKKNFGKVDLYNAGWNYYKGNSYPSTDSVFTVYTQKYPDDIFGWYMRARASEGIDSTGKQGMAKPNYDKVIEIGALDTAKNRAMLLTSYNYMVAYNYNIAKDNAAACDYTKKILELDPNNNQSLENLKALCGGVKIKSKVSPGAPGEKPKTEVKVKEKSSQPGTH